MEGFRQIVCRQHVIRRAVPDNLSFGKQQQPVAKLGCHFQIMHDEDNGFPIPAKRPAVPEYFVGIHQIESRRGFIEKKDIRLLRQCLGQKIRCLSPPLTSLIRDFLRCQTPAKRMARSTSSLSEEPSFCHHFR